ncbi:hypothetical protein BUN12_1778 [Bacillus amyloliquefaciens]|jgi:hypothetical protein|nr:hypothetical protein BAMTA208_13540 [Bacillus amyloliquefaciens TA208]AEB64378.1 hypothetical protein LL3_02846 [Bacillus amyloliquefaciens LL3]AEK89897.1 hypothetical protein BAXH7_02771 [Bacillus amyloliquefaciens XH7]AIW34577.1 hypothetical protein KS08_13310 [Bacillus subtilis]ARW39890.1 hypothetical protein S101267_02804 [Bacillus amyloliquefaciens]
MHGEERNRPRLKADPHCIFLETTLRRFPAERFAGKGHQSLGSGREPALTVRAGMLRHSN